ncbi:hypothetical protein P9112_002476 [Eukaryota sp. TZLM1-RC]
MKRQALSPLAGYVTGFVTINKQAFDAFASKNHGGQLLVCPHRYFGLYRDRYPGYPVATDAVSLRFQFSRTVKLTRKKRTKIEKKYARAAKKSGGLYRLSNQTFQDNTAENHQTQKTKDASQSATKACPVFQPFLCGHGPQSH